MIFISHNLAVVNEIADRLAVMYAGELVEIGSKNNILRMPRHPYTKALRDSIPTAATSRLTTIPGQTPTPAEWPTGCVFHPRCAYVKNKCKIEKPFLEKDSACFYPLN